MASSISDSVPGAPQTQRPVDTSQTTPTSATRDGITRREPAPATQDATTRPDAPPPRPSVGAQRGQKLDLSV